ncbi:MAG: hypothetical protein FWD40_06230 [Treponema sp.]|nr:hypothetical protein [Treponema sp.]
MRIAIKHALGQLCLLSCIIFIICSCGINRDETPVIPPETSPLSGDYIGFGVITSSFTHITSDPSEDSSSLGYLRRGTLVRIIRRQVLRTPEGFVSWVLTDGNHDDNFRLSNSMTGWLKEEVMDIYNNESQARTASESMSK